MTPGFNCLGRESSLPIGPPLGSLRCTGQLRLIRALLPESPLFFWIGNLQHPWMRSSSTLVTFLSAVGRGTYCISALHIRSRPDTSSTSITESASHRQPPIISSGLVTHSDFRPSVANTAARLLRI